VERAVLAEAGAPLPPRIDFSEEMGPVRDQGPEGSVVGFVIAAVMEHLILKKTARKIQLSARAIYNLAKKSPQDTGAMLADGVAVVQREGAVLEQVWPYKPGDFGKKPPAKFGKAERFKVAKAFQIEDQRKIREALCAYGPLAAGIVVHSSFWKTGKTGVVPKPAGGIIGGHAICLVGYDDKIARFKFRNSWARSWGDNGYGYLPYAYATTEILQDIWALQLA
jgi:C1A family cysteine protease